MDIVEDLLVFQGVEDGVQSDNDLQGWHRLGILATRFAIFIAPTTSHQPSTYTLYEIFRRPYVLPPCGPLEPRYSHRL